MYDVLDICRYIINYSEISNLKLQKLLYFIQAQFLNEYKKPCFKDELLAWNFGPVVLRAYNQYSCYGALSIPSSNTYLEYTPDVLWDVKRKTFDKNIIKKKHRKIIEMVVDIFENYSNAELTELILHQKPYVDAYNSNGIITLNSLFYYFK